MTVRPAAVEALLHRDTDAKRPFIRGKLVDLALVVGALLANGAALGVTLAERASSAAVPSATFAFIYRFMPAVPTRMRGIWPGALTAVADFEALQYGFSVYVPFL